MKKVLLLMMLIAAVAQLKAQNLNKAPNNSLDKFFKLKPLTSDSSLSKFIPVLPQKGLSKNYNGTTLNTQDLVTAVTVYDNMPVVKTWSNDRMPIVKTDEPGVKYHMLIKKLGTETTETVERNGKVTP